MVTDHERHAFYPLLRDSVNIYLHLLKRGDDGKLHLPVQHSPEYGNMADNNYNLSLLRWACETLIALRKRYGIDDPKLPEWKRVLADLTPYPVDETGLMVGAGVPLKKSHRHWSHMLMVFPLYQMNLDQPENRALVEKSIKHWLGTQGGRHRDRVARRGSSTPLYVGLGVGALAIAAAALYVTSGSAEGRRRRRARPAGTRTAKSDDAASKVNPKADPKAGAGGDASTATAASPKQPEPLASTASAAATADAASPEATSAEPDATASVEPAAADPAEAPAEAPEEAAAQVEPIPVETGEFTPPELPSSVEVSPVKWPSATPKDFLSPTDVVAGPEGKRLYVAQLTAGRVAMFNIAESGAGKIVPMPAPPAGLALSPDGNRLFVMCSSPKGTVEILDANSGSKLGSVSVGHTPVAVVVSPDGGTLYVCNRFNNDISIVDVASKRETKRIKVVNEPMAAALTPDGRVLFVANHLPAGRADAEAGERCASGRPRPWRGEPLGHLLHCRREVYLRRHRGDGRALRDRRERAPQQARTIDRLRRRE